MPSSHIPEVPSRELPDFGSDHPPVLPLIDGPWLEDEWAILDIPGRRYRKSSGACAVMDCTGPRFAGTELVSLCHGHYWRWRRDDQPPIADWAARPHRPVIQKNLPLSVRSVKFSELPAAAAEEIRYVFGFKLSNGDWTPTPALRQCLELLSI